eukprot:775965_1
MKAVLASFLLLVGHVAGLGCPTDPNISQACLDAVLPPPMVCAFSPGKTAQDYVDHAKDSATRCCGDDISACKCPVAGEAPFQAKIGDYCKAVAEDCDKPVEDATVTAGYLRGGFDMEELIQREEYAL